MARIPNLTGSLVVAVKFTYRQIVLLVLLSLAFSLLSVLLVPAGAAVLALFETIRIVPEDHRSDLARLKTYLRSVRRNLVSGLSLSVLLVVPPIATLLYINLALAELSGYLFLAGLVCAYLSLVAFFLVFRVANVRSLEPEIGTNAAFRRAVDVSSAHPHFAVLHSCLIVAAATLTVVLPPFVFLLFPGFVAVLEIVMYEQAAETQESPIRQYLSTTP
ncbi:DUF624 domain-containing protein [Halalkalicoccus subterraneus]|uniref:DUF624 domain-containing protein n=1 Tax=Halalkalicoccus subterraneus TaxID=2675002 RepID=UPI000EFAC27F|nr:DUF624 domain-containing protein [Halalkalicoccus subterraneus]